MTTEPDFVAARGWLDALRDCGAFGGTPLPEMHAGFERFVNESEKEIARLRRNIEALDRALTDATQAWEDETP